jgi:TrmH family RNA methyltransferase
MSDRDGSTPAARNVRFVLVGPQSSGNIGAAARALKNLGFRRLVLVRPECDHLDSQARMFAVEAAELLEGARVHDDLDDALAGAGAVVGLTRRTGKHRWPHRSIDEFAGEMASLAAAGELALVFGREDSGLTDAELDRCTQLVFLPTSEDYPSLNLAQALLLVAWELRAAGSDLPVGESPEPPADHLSREAMYEHLEQALSTIGFLHDDSTNSIMRRLRRLYGRANLTAREAQLLRGMARQILWAAGKAGLGTDRE